MKVCSADGCDKPHLARGLCGTHYAVWRRRNPTAVRKKVGPTYGPPQPCACGCQRIVSRPENRYIHGHHSRGDHHPMKRPEVAAKVSASMKRVHGADPNMRVARGVKSAATQRRNGKQLAQNHPRWRSDDQLTYANQHHRLRSLKSGVCDECHESKPTAMALIHGRGDRADIRGQHARLLFSVHPEDYREMCVRCHIRYDRQQASA